MQSGRRKQIDALIFVSIGIIGLGITDIVIWIFTHYMGVNFVVSKLIAFCMVFFWNFGARHLFFKNNFESLDTV